MQRTISRLRVRESSLPILEAVADACMQVQYQWHLLCMSLCTVYERFRDANFMSQDNHYVVFCPPYYETPSLYEALSITDAFSEKNLLVASPEEFGQNRGEIYFHESLVCSRA